MAHNQETIWCVNCGAEILGAPLIREGRDYCCQDCYEGRACLCGERMEPNEERRSRTVSSASEMSEPG